MSGFLVDTNVLSELRRGERCHAGVRAWVESVEPDELYLSALVVGEVRRGIESVRRRDRRAAARLETWLAALLADHADRVLPVSLAVAEEWGRMSVPDPLPVVDGLLAATARIHGLTLVTRNVRDVVRTGVPVVDPFAGPSSP